MPPSRIRQIESLIKRYEMHRENAFKRHHVKVSWVQPKQGWQLEYKGESVLVKSVEDAELQLQKWDQESRPSLSVKALQDMESRLEAIREALKNKGEK